MLTIWVVAGLALALMIAAFAWKGAPQLVSSRSGRLALLTAAAVLPVAITAAAMGTGIKQSSRTEFCLSCHEMETYGQTLFADNPRALAAAHYQNRRISRDETCFSCHTDYAMFGDFKAKLNGLRHVWVHYLGTIPKRPHLYQPYPNYNCLHCHEDARRFVEAPVHASILTDLQTGKTSCLVCHTVAHDHQAVADRRLWQAQ